MVYEPFQVVVFAARWANSKKCMSKLSIKKLQTKLYMCCVSPQNVQLCSTIFSRTMSVMHWGSSITIISLTLKKSVHNTSRLARSLSHRRKVKFSCFCMYRVRNLRACCIACFKYVYQHTQETVHLAVLPFSFS